MKERQHGIKDIDPGFLVFMIGVCHVKIYVKLAALLFFVAYLGFRRYRFLAPPSYVVFYAALIGLGAFSSWLEGSFSDPNYPFGFGFGSFVFLIAGAASYATYLAATQMDIHRLMASIKGFFGLNALYSLVIFLA